MFRLRGVRGVCCSDPNHLCADCAREVAAGAHRGLRARELSLDGIEARQGDAVAEVLFETRRHFGGCSARVAVELSTAIARDLVGLGPYHQALKRKGLTHEAEYKHHGTEPPNPYDLALARRGATR